MMKIAKRAISVLMVFVMVISLCGINVYASENSSSTTDTTAPTIDLSTLSVSTTEAGPGDTVTVTVKVTDDTAVSSVMATYVSPETSKWKFMYFTYNSGTGLYEGTENVTDNTEAGEWYIEMITASDSSNNSITYDGVGSVHGTHADLSGASFTVSGTSADITAPVIDTSTLKVNYKSIGNGATEIITVKVTDDTAVSSVMATYVTPKTSSWKFVYFTYDSTTGLYQGIINIDSTSEVGNWYIGMITLSDTSSNSITYDGVGSTFGTHADLSAASFEKTNTEYITLSETTYSIHKNYSDSITGTTYPESAVQVYTYSSGDTNVFTVDNTGKIKAVGVGEAELTVSNGSVSAKSEITVYEHTPVIDPAVPATCTADGKTEGSHCSVCGEVLVAQIPIAKAHKPVIDPAVPATCTTDGKTEGSHCSVCGKVLVAQIPIEKMHKLTHYARVEGTTSTQGNIEYWYCSVCGKYFSDANATQEITKDQTIIEKSTVIQSSSPSSDEVKIGTTITVSDVKYTVTGTDTVQYTTKLNAKGTVTIPSTVKINGNTYKVTSIAKNAFKGNNKISKVVIGNEITSIGMNAFSRCSALKSVTISKKVTTIGSSAFYGCKKLKLITIKTTKLTKKTIGSNVCKGINAKVTIKAPKAKLSAYKKWLSL